MGIEDLWPTIKGAKKVCALDDLSSTYGIKCVANDGTLVVNQFYRSAWSDGVKSGKPSVEGSYKVALGRALDLTDALAKLGIANVWCFDGDKDNAKLATARRKEGQGARTDRMLAAWQQAKASAVTDDEKALLVPYEEAMSAHIAASASRAGSPAGAQASEEDDSSPSSSPPSSPSRSSTSRASPSRTETMSPLEEAIYRLQSAALFPPDIGARLQRDLAEKGHRCIRVPEISEGEKLASILNHIGYVQAVYSDDGDLIALGTPVVIKYMNFSGRAWPANKGGLAARSAEVYLYGDVVQELGVPAERVFDVCVILSNDFNKRVRLHGPVKAKKLANDKAFSLDAFEATHGSDVVQLANCRLFLQVSPADIELVASRLQG